MDQGRVRPMAIGNTCQLRVKPGPPPPRSGRLLTDLKPAITVDSRNVRPELVVSPGGCCAGLPSYRITALKAVAMRPI
jgi:hypothetical protein